MKAGLTSWPLFFFFTAFARKSQTFLATASTCWPPFDVHIELTKDNCVNVPSGRRHADGPVVVQLLEGRGRLQAIMQLHVLREGLHRHALAVQLHLQ